MSSPNDLVNLADAKAYIYKTPAAVTDAGTTNDVLLAQMITRMSQMIYSSLQRMSFAAQTVTEIRNGTGTSQLVLRRWPVLSVSSVIVDGQSISAIPAIVAGVGNQAGYSFEAWDGAPPGRPQSVALQGYGFGRGVQNVRIDYVAGYQVTAEAQTIASGAATVSAPYGPWMADGGVTYATGTPFIKVTGTTPAIGHYALDATTPGKYLFNTSDNAAAILITYNFAPADLVQAVIEWLADRYAYMQRVGESSKTAGGQVTASFIVKAIPDFVQLALQPYRNVLPI